MFSCNLNYKEYSDGWYSVGYDDMGNTGQIDGPFTEREVDEMLRMYMLRPKQLQKSSINT